MGRKIDKEKYERILKRLGEGETQSSIVRSEKCSFGTISAAKEWDKEGRPTTLTTKKYEVGNTSKIIFSIPNFWLEPLNDKIEEGLWLDYSDAIVDIIRTYFRTQIDEIKPPNGKMPTFGSFIADKDIKIGKIRKSILQEYKQSFSKEEISKDLANVIPLKNIEEELAIIKEEKEMRKKELEEELKAINDFLEKNELKEEG